MASTPAPPFVRLDSQVVWRGRRLSMERVRYRAPDGEEFEREFTRHPGAVGVIPLDDQGMVTLVRQFRAPLGTTVLEMPAGTCDHEGEDPLSTARRELAEEVGLEASCWARLGRLPVSPGVTNQETTVFLATGLRPCPTAREGPEERSMTTERVPLDQVLQLAAAGERIDAPTLAGVALAQRIVSGARP